MRYIISGKKNAKHAHANDTISCVRTAMHVPAKKENYYINYNKRR